MIEIERPEVFDHIADEGYKFFGLDDYGYIALRRRCKFADVHIEVHRWSHSVLKHLKKHVLPEVKSMCRAVGVERIIAQKTGIDKRWPKFIKHFGFIEPETIQMSYMDVNNG